MDITGIESLEEALRDLQAPRRDVILCGANPRVKAKLDKAGLLDIVGPGGYHDDLHAALNQVDWGATLADQPGRTETEETRCKRSSAIPLPASKDCGWSRTGRSQRSRRVRC